MTGGREKLFKAYTVIGIVIIMWVQYMENEYLERVLSLIANERPIYLAHPIVIIT